MPICMGFVVKTKRDLEAGIEHSRVGCSVIVMKRREVKARFTTSDK